MVRYVPFRYIVYPVTPTLSVDPDHEMLMLEEDCTEIDATGAVGAWVSPDVPEPLPEPLPELQLVANPNDQSEESTARYP